ncbi:MAG: acyl-CoA dehydrogenase family protein [Myxococcota bacterium]
MNFGFTEEQDFLREAVRKFVDERAPMAEVRTLMETEHASSDALWSEMAAMGWLGLLVPDEYGGAGLGWVDFVVLLGETGRTLLPSPLLSSALAMTAVAEAGSPAQKEQWLPRFASGELKGSLAWLEASDIPTVDGIALTAEVEGAGASATHLLRGEKAFVADAGGADVFVLIYRDGDELALALVPKEAEGVSVRSNTSLDETKRSGTLCLDGVRVAPADRLSSADAAETAAFLLDCGAVAVTAEALGAAEGALAITVQYAKDRVQFGSPIGRYQGVKHRLADIWMDTESIKSLLYYGAWAIENERSALPRYASLAKAYVADAFTRIGVDCVQLHGAVGYTLEYDIQLYLKRSKWVRGAYGDADFHRDRLASLRDL